MIYIEVIVAVIVGYLLGSISFAAIIARHHGVDILKTGSGNPGATNVKRSIGKGAGNLCFGLDFLKGVISAGLPMLGIFGCTNPEIAGVLGLCGAIAGHSYPLFLKFRGGKGVAVTMGGLLILMHWVLIAGVIVWGAVFYSTRYVSLASIMFGVSLPIVAILTNGTRVSIVLAVCVSILIILRHRSNISRLLKGTESRFEKK